MRLAVTVKKLATVHRSHRVRRAVGTAIEHTVALTEKHSAPVPIELHETGAETDVDEYWSQHTVNSRPFVSARQVRRYLEWRFREYPKFRELSGLWGGHAGQRIVDYGCGPGNDLAGYYLYGRPASLVGFDISAKSLRLAAHRLSLLGAKPNEVRLIQLHDDLPTIPLPDGSVDHVNSQGVLHHTSNPDAILREFVRILRPGGTATVMVYNRNSIWYHLYVPYELIIVQGAYPGFSVDEVFPRTTDGPDCPLARNYAPDEFGDIARAVGFHVEYAGGFLSSTEVDCIARYGSVALTDERLDQRHRMFLGSLATDADGLPKENGRYAGIGGTYHLRRL